MSGEAPSPFSVRFHTIACEVGRLEDIGVIYWASQLTSIVTGGWVAPWDNGMIIIIIAQQ